MYFENTGHLGGVTEDDIQRISITLPKFPVYFDDVILSDPTHMSGFECQGTVKKFLHKKSLWVSLLLHNNLMKVWIFLTEHYFLVNVFSSLLIVSVY